MPNQYLRQDKYSRLMSPVTGVQEQPAVPGQPVEIGNNSVINPALLPGNYDPCINVVADEQIQAGDLCYLINVAGVRKIRKASSLDRTTLSTLFVKNSYNAGDPAVAYIHGMLVIPNPGTFTTADTGLSLYLHETIPGYVQEAVPNSTTAWIQRAAIITDVTPTEIRCYYIGFLDRGKSPGSSVVDTDPLVLAHIHDMANPHQTTAAQVGAVAQAAVGAASGVAPLGSDQIVPDINLPLTQWKRLPVRVAVLTNVTLASPGAALDGVTLVVGDRALLLGQTNPVTNGVYVWNGAAVPMTRATDADNGIEVLNGLWLVTSGTQAASGWINSNASLPTVGTTALTFTRVIGTPSFTNPMTTQGDMIVAASNGAPSRLAAGNNGQVMTMVGGVPQWQTLNFTGMTNPMTAFGDIIVGGSGGTAGRLAAGNNGQVLTLVSGLPAWVAPATGMPNPLTNAGDIVVADSGGNPGRLGVGADGTVLTMVAGRPQWHVITFTGMTNPMTGPGELIIGGSGGAATRLPVGANGQVLTLVSGAPAWVAPATGFTNPMTNLGDLMVGGTGGQATRMGKGSDGQVLMMVSGSPAWANGMINPMNAAGDLILGGASGTPTRLAKGSNGQVLTLVAGSPAWAAPTTGFVSPMTNPGDLIIGGTGGAPLRLAAGSNGQVLTLVAGSPEWQSLAAYMTNPMSASGDMIVGGTSGAPTRISKGADGQVLTLVAGAPAWANSSSGFANPMSALGDLIVGGSGGTGAHLAVGSNGQVLTVVAGVPAWAAASGGMANPMSAAGDLIIGGTGGAATRLAKGSDGQVLTLVSGSPAWQTPSGGSGGGMANPMSAAGDLIIGGATGTPGRLGAGSDGQVLKMVAGTPAWAAESGGGSGGSGLTITAPATINFPTPVPYTNSNYTGENLPNYAWNAPGWDSPLYVASVPAEAGATYQWEIEGLDPRSVYQQVADIDDAAKFQKNTIHFQASVYTSIRLKCTVTHPDGTQETAVHTVRCTHPGVVTRPYGNSLVGHYTASDVQAGVVIDGPVSNTSIPKIPMEGIGAMVYIPQAGATAPQLYFVSGALHSIRVVSDPSNMATATFSTLAGANDGSYESIIAPGPAARFKNIQGMCLDPVDNNNLIITDQDSAILCRVNRTTGDVTVLAGTPGTSATSITNASRSLATAEIIAPSFLCSNGNMVYFIDRVAGDNPWLVRQIDLAQSTIKTLSDLTSVLSVNTVPTALAVDNSGNVYVSTANQIFQIPAPAPDYTGIVDAELFVGAAVADYTLGMMNNYGAQPDWCPDLKNVVTGQPGNCFFNNISDMKFVDFGAMTGGSHAYALMVLADGIMRRVWLATDRPAISQVRTVALLCGYSDIGFTGTVIPGTFVIVSPEAFTATGSDYNFINQSYFLATTSPGWSSLWETLPATITAPVVPPALCGIGFDHIFWTGSDPSQIRVDESSPIILKDDILTRSKVYGSVLHTGDLWSFSALRPGGLDLSTQVQKPSETWNPTISAYTDQASCYEDYAFQDNVVLPYRDGSMVCFAFQHTMDSMYSGMGMFPCSWGGASSDLGFRNPDGTPRRNPPVLEYSYAEVSYNNRGLVNHITYGSDLGVLDVFYRYNFAGQVTTKWVSVGNTEDIWRRSITTRFDYAYNNKDYTLLDNVGIVDRHETFYD